MSISTQMADCVNEITLQALWQCEVSEEEEEEYINDQVVPLNHMVRKSYLKYLKQVITENLSTCSDSNSFYAPHDIEKCVGLLELKALRLCMVTSLYQKAILHMVAEIKDHTKESRLYNKFSGILSQTCLCKLSKCQGTQTDLVDIKVEGEGNILENQMNHVNIKTEKAREIKTTLTSPEYIDYSSQVSVSVSSNLNFYGTSVSQVNTNHNPSNISLTNFTKDTEESCDILRKNNDNEVINAKELDDHVDKTSFVCKNLQQNKSLEITQNTLKPDNKVNELQNSNIETNVNNEQSIKELTSFLSDDNSKFGEALLYETAAEELIRILESEGELSELEDEKQREEINLQVRQKEQVHVSSFWKTQSEIQKAKLHGSISRTCCDPPAKVKMKNKFFKLFGFDSDEDDVWCSKETIAQYRKRIAPHVVKHLLPYYQQQRILSRDVFKHVASHITDKLISFKHLSEEDDVKKGIKLFFSYHGFIGEPADIWMGWDKELQ